MTEPTEPETPPALDVPDLRVVSIVHDADNDRFGITYDEDLDPYHALGLLIAGAFRQLLDLTELVDLEDVFEEGDDE